MKKVTTKEFKIFSKKTIEENPSSGSTTKTTTEKTIIEYPRHNKNIFTDYRFWLMVIITTIIIPFAVNSAFQIHALTPFFEGTFESKDLLIFEGTVVAAIILFITVKLTIESNYKNQLLSKIDLAIIELLRFLEIRKAETIKTQVSTHDKIKAIFELMDNIDEKYTELCIYLPKKQRDLFEKDTKDRFNKIHFDLLKGSNFYDAHQADTPGNKIDISDYENNELPAFNRYLDETRNVVKEAFYNIRHNM